MLIVLEGCDGTGKTTLANSLANILNAEVIHCSSKTPNNYSFFRNIIEASKDKIIIADRFCYGQYVYQKDGERPLGSTKILNELESQMLNGDVKVVYVTAPTKEISKRLSARNEFLINGLTIDEVKFRFESLFRDVSIFEKVVVWDTGGEQFDLLQ